MSPGAVTDSYYLSYLKGDDVLVVVRHYCFLKTDDNLFSHIDLQPTVTTSIISAFPGDHLSSVLQNSSAKIFRLSLGCLPLTQGSPLVVPSDATASLPFSPLSHAQ